MGNPPPSHGYPNLLPRAALFAGSRQFLRECSRKASIPARPQPRQKSSLTLHHPMKFISRHIEYYDTHSYYSIPKVREFAVIQTLRHFCDELQD